MGYLIWDFDGTLATRAGGWASTLCEVVAEEYPRLAVTPDAVRPLLQNGFPWNAHEVVRTPGSADDWWEDLTPLFARVLRAMTDVSDEPHSLRLARRVREVYLREDRWTLYDDVVSTLTALTRSGWTHLVLSNHAPEFETIIGRLGLTPLVGAVYNSALTGKEKPNPAAYECVFADYQAARDGWMIGDNWIADVQGAAAVGLRSILVRREHPEASLRCETLHDVIDVIETRRGGQLRSGSCSLNRPDRGRKSSLKGGKNMHTRLGVRSLVLAIALLVAACGGGRTAIQSGESATVLEVVNRATLDMTIYIVSDSGGRERLGTASSLETTRLTIPRRLVASALDMSFVADPVGSNRTVFSERVSVIPGDVVVLEIPPAF